MLNAVALKKTGVPDVDFGTPVFLNNFSVSNCKLDTPPNVRQQH